MRTVDNPLMPPPSSPKPRQPLRSQRATITQNYDQYTDQQGNYYDDEQSDENECSNEFEKYSFDEIDNTSGNDSVQSQNNSKTIPLRTINNSSSNNNSVTTTSNHTNVKYFKISILVLLFSPSIWYWFGTESTYQTTSNHRKLCDINALKTEFPQQEDKFWKTIKSGIETTINVDPTKPSVFLLIYHDKNVVKKFTKTVIDVTQKCMETEHNEAVILNNNDMSTEDIRRDYGVAIKKYRQKMTESGVLFVEDLNKISATAAQAFHVMCDTVSPLVSRLIIYMTMYIDPLNQPFSLLEHVEEQLKSNWSELQPNIFDPLLARVTDQVILLK